VWKDHHKKSHAKREAIMRRHEPWQLGENPDALYERYLVPAMFGPWAADLVALAAPQPGERVLDVACGTGIVTRLVAPYVGSTGHVVGLDLDAGRLAVARALPPAPGVVVEWREVDALALPFAEAVFNLVCCQQGLQFFPDRPAALREMHRVLVPGGRLVLNVWRAIEYNPVALAMAQALGRHVSPEAEAYRHRPFALGDAAALRALVVGAGFGEVIIRPVVKVLRFPSAEAFVQRYIASVAPLAQMVAQANDQARAALLSEVSAAVQAYVDADGLAMPKASHLVTARR
jgi:ubiquinone/menaquinone biosynthesis C-methylase UbiE